MLMQGVIKISLLINLEHPGNGEAKSKLAFGPTLVGVGNKIIFQNTGAIGKVQMKDVSACFPFKSNS